MTQPGSFHRALVPCLLVAVSLLGAGCGQRPAPQGTGSSILKGVYGQYYYVNVSRPTGGTVRSADGRIDCGVSGSSCGDANGQTQYPWTTASLDLVATPDAVNGWAFDQWAGDCSGTSPTCTVTAGADRFVVAVFKSAAGSPGGSGGSYGQTFVVSVSRSLGGEVRSDDGQIACGTMGTACTGRYPWSATAVLRATPDQGYGFQAWAGDCALIGPCLLDTSRSGADKTVAAVFALAGQVGHGNWTPQAIHGPGYFDFLAQAPGALQCPTCHGPTLAGQGNAPACASCHTAAGWASWSDNCSFCHGARNATTQAGYAFASNPAWAAPPDALAQRLDPAHAPVPLRTGAHQAHLLGVTPSGLRVGPFQCATCHPVPTGLSHIKGAGQRAQVALVGAGQGHLPASLGSYDPAAGTCATYCHGNAGSPPWSSLGMRCDGCHGVAPPAPHPYQGSDLTACAGCHPDSINPDGSIKAGGLHLDGAIQASGGHGDFTSPAVHGPAFLDFMGGAPGALTCTGCHGPTYDGGVGPSCNACHASQGWSSWRTDCSFCHGRRSVQTQVGYDVSLHPTWAAPPDAVAQRLDPAHAPAPLRTGAHQAHLLGATPGGLSVAPAFLCQTCHAVPTDLTHIGGSTSRATVALLGAGQASLPASLGAYDPASGTCATYCHGPLGSPAWSFAGLQCNGCHGTPPAPSTGHPDVGTNLGVCATCHPESMNGDGTIKVGGKHLDGVIQAIGAHGDFTSPATHGPRFFDYLGGASGALDCRSCHGPTFGGALGPSCNACHAAAGWASWQTDCSFCHGARNAATQAGYDVAVHPTWAAPPDALAQRLDPAHAPVPLRTGAHQPHLTGFTSGGLQFATAFTCLTCHPVPSHLSHVRGSSARANVALIGAGQASLPASLGTYDQASGTCSVYCHDSGGARGPSPAWSFTGLQCNGCHGVPPASPHPYQGTDLTACATCHPGTMNPNGTLNLAGGLHLDGTVQAIGAHGDFSSPATHAPQFFSFLRGTAGALHCTDCHGATYGGGVGPSCNACHAGAGWTGWQTNCSFCHGTKSPTTQAGYDVNLFPTYAAPPDALAQRLDPAHTPIPERTGAHQAHLTGVGTDGLNYGMAFQCTLCHTVPADLGHAGGTGRAPVVLRGFNQFLPASLGTYNPADGTCAVVCHTQFRPTWTGPPWSGPAQSCDGCHGYPPSTGLHNFHMSDPTVVDVLQRPVTCGDCHSTTATTDFPSFVIPGVPTHIDGQVQVSFADGGDWNHATLACTAACHSFRRTIW